MAKAAPADTIRGLDREGGLTLRWEDSAPPRYELQEDLEWDVFLNSRGGHHLQSSHWRRAKSVLGWRGVRVSVVQDGTILGGAQVLLRRLHGMGRIAYVPRGPTLTRPDEALVRRVLEGVDMVARDHHVLLLVVQPPVGHEHVVPALEDRGFRPASSLIDAHPTATVVVDVTADDETLLATMKAKTRYNTRLAERRGITVRVGGEGDVLTLHRLLTLTGQRQGFAVPSSEYLRHMVRATGPEVRANILVAEYRGEPVSSALLIGFGDTVIFKRGGWSGRHSSRHPNELLHWTAMRWARGQGYRYYDFEGIDASALDASAEGRGDAEVPYRRSVSTFKLGFGGQVVLSPGAYERISHPVLRHGYDWLVPHLLDSSPGQWLRNSARIR